MPATAKLKIERRSHWAGNGFGRVTLHIARRGDRVVGEFRSGSATNWAGEARGIVCMFYAGWRKALEATR